MLEIKNCFQNNLFLWVGSMVILGLMGCSKENGRTEREVTIQLLTNNNEKYWVVDESNIDGKEITLSSCDSSYVLIMKADFTWKESYFKFQCNPGGLGQWSLNDANNVISIFYINPATGMQEEKLFEIEELSEDYLAYQFAENNRLRYIRLRINFRR